MLRGARNQKMNMVEISVEFFEGEIVLSGDLADNASKRPFNHRRYYLPAVLYTLHNMILN
jgi:hypothetical protein